MSRQKGPMPKPIRVKVVGCGGIGGTLLPVLCCYLNHDSGLYSRVEMILIDGDSYEPRNVLRQGIRPGLNKAQAMADMLAAQFARIFLRAERVYVTRDNVAALIEEGDVVFCCVDNHATRKLISDRCCELERVTLISGGNGYAEGCVQFHIREQGLDRTLPIANVYHPEILHPADHNPGDRAIDSPGRRRAEPPVPRLLITDNAVAAAMLNGFYAHQRGRLAYDEVYLDVVENRVRPARRSPDPLTTHPRGSDEP